VKIKVSWIFPVAAGVTVFLLLGNFLENSEYFRPLRSTLRSRSVPTGMLNYGALGKNLKRMERILAVPNDFQRFPKSGRASIDRNANIFQKKRLVTDRLFISNPRGAAGFPSTRMMAGKTFHKGWPVISIAVNKDFLYDEKTGILTNFTKRGREWEKLAYVSYFEDGNLLFASGCGLRLHGGSSRKLGRHFRLYFREDYGANQFQPGVLLSPEAQPIKRVVVHYDWPDETPFVSCLAYDIARRMGCDAPEAKPALLYFNGNPRGLYFVSEHVGRKQWESHVGHSRFLFRRYRAVSDAESEKGFGELMAWSLDPHVRMTMEEAAKHVDLDKLTRNLLSYAFCATDDWNQGAAVLDKTKTVPQWYWVNWDMDRSFFFQTPVRTYRQEGKNLGKSRVGADSGSGLYRTSIGCLPPASQRVSPLPPLFHSPAPGPVESSAQRPVFQEQDPVLFHACGILPQKNAQAGRSAEGVFKQKTGVYEEGSPGLFWPERILFL